MIRVLEATDVASFQRLRLFALQESPDAFGSTYLREEGRSLEQVASRIVSREDGSITLGYFSDKDELIGIIGLAREDGPRETHKGFIWGMYVHPEHRCQRIGQKLVEGMIAHAKQVPGLRHLKLTVTATSHAARKLYASCKFVTYGIEKNSLATQGGFLDEELMVLTLESEGGTRI